MRHSLKNSENKKSFNKRFRVPISLPRWLLRDVLIVYLLVLHLADDDVLADILLALLLANRHPHRPAGPCGTPFRQSSHFPNL